MLNYRIFVLCSLFCILLPLETVGFGIIFPETSPLRANAAYYALKSVEFSPSINLAKRQSGPCPNDQYLPCQFTNSQCCPIGGSCCRWANDTQVGCCLRGQTCGTDYFTCDGIGPTCSEDKVTCTNFESKCCPRGFDCDTTGTSCTTVSVTSSIPLPTSSIATQNVTTFTTTFSGTASAVASPSATALSPLNQCCQKTCKFSSPERMADTTFAHVLGRIVENCANPTRSFVETKFTSSTTLTRTWSVDTTIGFSAFNTKIESTVSIGGSNALTWTQEVTLKIEAGFKGALVANVRYRRFNGSLDFGPSTFKTFAITNEPLEIYSVGNIQTPCNSSFPFELATPSNCTSTSNSSSRERMALTTSLSVFPILLLVFGL